MNNGKGERDKRSRAKKQVIGNHKVGYGRPPESGRIKENEVRNPHGRNGKPKGDEDPFTKVMARKSRVTIDGEEMLMTTQEAIFLKLTADALKGNTAAARILQKEIHVRRLSEPAPLTAEELVQEAADEQEKQRISEKFVRLLNELASMKKNQAGTQLPEDAILQGPAGKAQGADE